ncbi:MAG TPA: adenosylcobinamide-GDP ribazoletransferase [Bryobacteraceae bacterium]|nr:adenosylcobinamide-GDP ribazoletransferase [Bryobacteraceae bacterium]
MAAVAFLTRFPVGRMIVCDSTELARSAGWFPLIGIFLGAIYYLAATTLRTHLPLGVVSVLFVILDGIATGALHFDGLTDTADGFGGGKSSEDILRIMRDHAIGSYGGFALASAIVLKVTAYTALLNRSNWVVALILTPAMGRWAILLLTATLRYARQSRSVTEGMGKGALLWGTVLMLLALTASKSLRACIALLVIVTVTAGFGLHCRRRIGGITGDTLGANLQLCECAALLTFLWTGLPQ